MYPVDQQQVTHRLTGMSPENDPPTHLLVEAAWSIGKNITPAPGHSSSPVWPVFVFLGLCFYWLGVLALTHFAPVNVTLTILESFHWSDEMSKGKKTFRGEVVLTKRGRVYTN